MILYYSKRFFTSHRSLLKLKERRSRNRKRKNAISTFKRVLKNGFYPNGFTKSNIRKAKYKRHKKERNYRVRNYAFNRRMHFNNILVGNNLKRRRRKYSNQDKRKYVKISDSFYNGPLCKKPRRKNRKSVFESQLYEKCNDNFRLSNTDNILPILLTPIRKHANFHNVYSEKRIRMQPKSNHVISSSERRIGHGFRGGHPGVNSIYVGKDESGILWPLLGLFGLFQLLTTGAIGKQIKLKSIYIITLNYTFSISKLLNP